MSLPPDMQAARLLGKDFQTIPLPEPGPGELLIKVVAAGLCHTDLIMPMAGHGGPLPITGSHEPAGVVVGLGPGAEKFKVGDRVMAVNTARGCESCANCKRYDQRWCPKAAMIGLRFMDGAFAHYCLVSARYAAIIPDGMSYEQAATFSCAGVTVYAAIKRAGLKKGDFIAFSGLGALGGLGMEMAKRMGLKVVGLDARDGPVEAARKAKYPGDILVNPTRVPVEEVVKQVQAAREPGYDYGEGVDAIIILNTSPHAVPYALNLLRPHGTIIFTAGPSDVSIPVLDFIWKDITAIGTQNGTAADMAEAAALCVQYGIKSTIRPYAFEEGEMNRMVQDVQGEEWSGKAVVRVDPDLWEM